MNEVRVKRLNGGIATIMPDSLVSLRAALGGQAVLPGDDGYDQARTVWNATVDNYPGLVVRCAAPSDVIQAMRFARQHDLLVAIRAGGHNIAGKAVADGALLVDLSRMRSIRVDPAARIAWVEPGATLADFDRETQAFGLTTPVGINSTTGMAGLTLGGGFGWTSRKLGMSIDNLIGADVVTADGRMTRASAKENADLFWALRGGGGNFGIVTGFEFRLRPVGPEIYGGAIAWPLSDAPRVLDLFRTTTASAPPELTLVAGMRKAPPAPWLPKSLHGQDMVALFVCYTGAVEEGERL